VADGQAAAGYVQGWCESAHGLGVGRRRSDINKTCCA
jgi:hypothetical protein